MTEHRTIKIAVYRDNDGHPVCARDFQAGKFCNFLMTARFGTSYICGMTNEHIERGPHDLQPGEFVTDPENHFLRPSSGCKVWVNDE